MTDRPNILYIFTDQQFAGAMGCAGNADLRTAAMDSLAASGVRFDLAYCTTPLCSPSRSSMFTGLMPSRTGVPSNGMSIRPELRERELGHLLSGAGYHCAYGGKWHLPKASIEEGHAFERICDFGDDGLADACVDFLRRKHERPFFLVASFDNPHNICEWARSQELPWGPVPEPARLEDCPNLPANFAVGAFEPEVIRIEQKCDAQKYPVVSFTQEDWRRYRYAYYRLVEKVDWEIGRVLDALRDAGLEERTVLILSSDHGDGHGAHQWNQKSVLYEEAVRVPLIISFKGYTKPGLVDDTRLVSNGLDLLPTVCDYAQVGPPGDLEGMSLRPVAEGAPPATWREAVFSETIFDGARGYQTRGLMVRTSRYKYVAYHWGRFREQLFDMENDPGEMVNLAVDSRRRDVLNHHRRLLSERVAGAGYRLTVPTA